jgi:hypothetical protein
MFELEFSMGSANGCMDGGMEVERSWLMSSRRAASDSELVVADVTAVDGG